MTDSQNNVRRRALRFVLSGSAAGCLILSGGAAFSQESSSPVTPQSLAPPSADARPVERNRPVEKKPVDERVVPAVLPPLTAAPVAAPRTAAPVDATPVGAAPQREAGARPGTARIVVDSLQGIDPDSIGTLSAEQGGFGSDAWRGTARGLVEKMLPRLPVESSSRAMRNLMRRLLLSTARAPEGEKKENLIAMRVGRLAAMGDVASVVALLQAAPTRGEDPALLQREAEVLFLTNDNARACPLVAGQMRGDSNAFWQQAFIFCQALAGEQDKASLGVSLLREQGVEDPVYYGLIDALLGADKFQIETLKNPASLHFAMARAAKARLPSDIVASDNPAVLRTIATSPNARPELRVDAAERAEGMGALSTDVLRQLYAGVTFSENDLANPLTRADADRSPLSRALLYRKALVESVPAAIAEVLSRALKLSREEGRYASTARVYQRLLLELAPSQDLNWFAPEAVRALLAAGQGEAAEKWFAILRTSALFNKQSADLRLSLVPLARLTGSQEVETWEPAVLGKWLALQRKPEGETPIDRDTVMARAGLLYNLLESIGDAVPDEQWAELLDGPPHVNALMPRPALWRMLTAAASDNRIGETVLAGLLALGQSGPTQANPTVLRKVIESLRQVGLTEDARALSVEAAIAAGI